MLTEPCKRKKLKTTSRNTESKAQIQHTAKHPSRVTAQRVSYASGSSTSRLKPTQWGWGGQVTSPWALKSPVSLKLGWDSEAHEKIRQGGGEKRRKKKMWIVLDRNNFRSFPVFFFLTREHVTCNKGEWHWCESTTENTTKRREVWPPVKKHDRKKLKKTAMDVETVTPNWNQHFTADEENWTHSETGTQLRSSRASRLGTEEQQLQPAGEARASQKVYFLWLSSSRADFKHRAEVQKALGPFTPLKSKLLMSKCINDR